jgi:hypothetical protein
MAPLMRPSQNASNVYDQQHSHNMSMEHRVTVVEIAVADHAERLSSLESIRHWVGEWRPVIIAAAIMALGLTGNLSAETVALTLKGFLE